MSQPGRGAVSNIPNRFERIHLDESIADEAPTDLEEGGPDVLRTRFYVDSSRTILTRNDSPDVPFEFSINPYRGCEHGCIYCYARPTHEYLGLSAGLDFETRIFVKESAPKLLRERLMSPAWKGASVSVSGVTDPYQPVERRLRVTRRCLEVLTEFRNPFTVITKNHLVTRDLDLFAPMAEAGAVGVFLTMTTLDAELCGKLEPRTSRPEARLRAIRELSAAGVPVGLMIAPVIPGLTDHELPRILEAAYEAGARHAGFVPLRLPGAVAPLFEEWLAEHFPDRKEKVLNRVRSLRDGKLNDPSFGSRMRGSGPFAEGVRQLFHLHTRRLGFNRERFEVSSAQFRRPGDQLRLF